MGNGSSPGERRGGRQKGTPNKTTQLAREAIAYAAERLGGAKRLAAWAKEDKANEYAFWTKIYPRLLPVQLTGEDGEPIKVERIERIIVDPNTDGAGVPPTARTRKV
jgi:hypothetical protein